MAQWKKKCLYLEIHSFYWHYIIVVTFTPVSQKKQKTKNCASHPHRLSGVEFDIIYWPLKYASPWPLEHVKTRMEKYFKQGLVCGFFFCVCFKGMRRSSPKCWGSESLRYRAQITGVIWWINHLPHSLKNTHTHSKHIFIDIQNNIERRTWLNREH